MSKTNDKLSELFNVDNEKDFVPTMEILPVQTKNFFCCC